MEAFGDSLRFDYDMGTACRSNEALLPLVFKKDEREGTK